MPYGNGYSYSEIVHILPLDDETIRNHVLDDLQEQKLKTSNRSSDGKLTGQETQHLIEHLNEIKGANLFICNFAVNVSLMF